MSVVTAPSMLCKLPQQANFWHSPQQLTDGIVRCDDKSLFSSTGATKQRVKATKATTLVAAAHLHVANGVLPGSCPPESQHQGVLIPGHKTFGVQLGLPYQAQVLEPIQLHSSLLGQGQNLAPLHGMTCSVQGAQEQVAELLEAAWLSAGTGSRPCALARQESLCAGGPHHESPQAQASQSLQLHSRVL